MLQVILGSQYQIRVPAGFDAGTLDPAPERSGGSPVLSSANVGTGIRVHPTRGHAVFVLIALAMLAEQVLCEDPYSGHLFVYVNRRADRVKILYWSAGGLALWYKRLEKGTFRLPDADDARVEIDATELSLILEGIDLERAKRQRRYQRMTRGEARNSQ